MLKMDKLHYALTANSHITRHWSGLAEVVYGKPKFSEAAQFSRYASVLRDQHSDSPRCWRKIKAVDALNSVIMLVARSRRITEEQ